MDGYISLAANPHLAYETWDTVAEVERLHARVDREMIGPTEAHGKERLHARADRPNVIFKAPATRYALC